MAKRNLSRGVNSFMRERNGKRCAAFTVWEIVLLLLIVAVFLAIAVPNFVKEPNTSPANACINNLRQIDAAKQEWAIESKITNGETVVTESQIINYFMGKKMSKCPSGGKYTIGKLNELPTCSLGTNLSPSHVLPP